MQTMMNLKHDEVPTQWYNILPDLPEPLPPPKDPEDGPSRLKNLPNLMIGECLNQEFSQENWIDIPSEASNESKLIVHPFLTAPKT